MIQSEITGHIKDCKNFSTNMVFRAYSISLQTYCHIFTLSKKQITKFQEKTEEYLNVLHFFVKSRFERITYLLCTELMHKTK